MTTTYWADVSYYQPYVNNSYPYPVLCFRSNDDQFRDPHFAGNIAWAKQAVKSGRLKGFFVYFVYRNENSWRVMRDMVGTPIPQMGVLIDVESWGGQMSGNHSSGLNRTRENIISWLNGSRSAATRALYKPRDRKRVVAYANQYDRASMWPQWGDAKWIIANYSYNPGLNDQIAHQFSASHWTPPFGNCDCNAIYNQNSSQAAQTLGIAGPAIVQPKPMVRYKFPLKKGQYFGEDYVNGKHNEPMRWWIKKIQTQLVKHGYVKVHPEKFVDGIYGPQTAAAILKFKKDKKFRTGAHLPYIGKTGFNRLMGL